MAEHAKAFVVLKTALMSSPVLKGPKYNGSSFTITTDGCKDGFAGVLTQRFQWTSLHSNTHTQTHPIAFASKCTSDSESCYKPYLLEFTALKYSLDKFSDTIAGYPVEVKTDCLALWDTILNNKLNATHARWLDGIMGHNIRNHPNALLWPHKVCSISLTTVGTVVLCHIAIAQHCLHCCQPFGCSLYRPPHMVRSLLGLYDQSNSTRLWQKKRRSFFCTRP